MAKRLLIVDDEAKLLRAVAITLREEGYEVTTARSGAEALVRINEGVPDLIVSDIRMPGMDGFKLARALRSNPRTALIPIIFLTAKDQREDRLAGIRTGVDAYLVKPFDPEELIAVVSNILSRVERTSAELARLVSTAGGDDGSPSDFEPDEDFTEAEARIALLVADGLSNKEIAAELNLSVRTIEGHISNILSKKGWSNRVEIARHVLGRGDAG
ncbi:MAG TPA: response regulator transcription factor [Pyrinomonadaceae bacterium]|nr:response regulator transcription factor [Pyrinomonadaceae bacterium]